jgi:hypothetical protein
MKHEMFDKAMAKAVDQIRILIDEETPRIKRAMDDAAVVASQAEKETFSFPIRFVVKVEPCGDSINVDAGISYGVKHSVKTETVNVNNQPELIKA